MEQRLNESQRQVDEAVEVRIATYSKKHYNNVVVAYSAERQKEHKIDK
jgi:hypothetical protein